MNKLFLFGMLGLLLVSSVLIFFNNQKNITNNQSEINQSYYGPVPLGYNQTHFWKTGEMIKEEKNNVVV